MNAIGFKNFRNFVEFPTIPTNGVSIFIGGNNAGKSTCSMAYRLLAQNLYKIIKGLPFDGDINNYTIHKFDFSTVCGNFERALSSYADNDTIVFNIQLGYFDITLQVTTQDKQSIFAKVVSIEIKDVLDDCSWKWRANEENAIFRYSGRTLAQIAKSKVMGLQVFANGKWKDKVESRLNIAKEALRKYEELDGVYEYECESYIEPFSLEQCKININGEDYKIVPVDFDDYNDNFDPKGDYKVFSDFFNHVRKDLEKACNPNQIKYFPAHETPLGSYFKLNNSDADSTTGVICQFFRLDSSQLKRWVIKMMQELEIGDGFDIELANSEELIVTITNKKGVKVPLADNGRGAVQLFILLLRMAMYSEMPRDFVSAIESGNKQMLLNGEDNRFPDYAFRERSTSKLLIVEEPEQNLHPKLQSKLADLFVHLHQNFGVNIVIETHSEYLVRRSQVLVAEAKYKDEQELAAKCPFKVYYLPEVGTGKPYDMEYRTDGKFRKKFGKGFFNVADDLMLELL